MITKYLGLTFRLIPINILSTSLGKNQFNLQYMITILRVEHIQTFNSMKIGLAIINKLQRNRQ